MNRKDTDIKFLEKGNTVKEELAKTIIEAIQKGRGAQVEQAIKSMIPPKV